MQKHTKCLNGIAKYGYNCDTQNFVLTEPTFYAYTLESGKLIFLIKNTRELQTL